MVIEVSTPKSGPSEVFRKTASRVGPVSTKNVVRYHDAVATVHRRLRLQLLRQQASVRGIVLFIQDKSEAVAHFYLAHTWAKRGADLRVEAPGQACKAAMLGVLAMTARQEIVTTTPRTEHRHHRPAGTARPPP